MRFINEIITPLSEQKLQKEAAIHGWRGEYEEAVIKMIGCYYKLDHENLRLNVTQQPVPKWLAYSGIYTEGQVLQIGSDFATRHSDSMDGNGLIAYEILNGDFGLAMQSMSAMILGQVANGLPNDMDDFYVMQIPRVIHPWNDLLLDMKPPVQEWQENVNQNLSGEFGW